MTAQTTERAARVLVGHMSEKEAKVPVDIIENLGELGIKVNLKSVAQPTEVKTTKEF